MSAKKRGSVRPTHEWELLLPLFEWPEQRRYEEIRPLVLFDAAVVAVAGARLFRVDETATAGCQYRASRTWVRPARVA